MNRLQSLFNRLAGISDHEFRQPAGESPATRHRHFAALEKPACWRRTPRDGAVAPILKSRRSAG